MFTRAAGSTKEDWATMSMATLRDQTADRMLAALSGLSHITDGFAIDQLAHSLQTASRAERAGADDEVVVARLMHDAGKVISLPNRAGTTAEIVSLSVRPEIDQLLRYHQDFEGYRCYHFLGRDRLARKRHRRTLGGKTHALAIHFVDSSMPRVGVRE